MITDRTILLNKYASSLGIQFSYNRFFGGGRGLCFKESFGKKLLIILMTRFAGDNRLVVEDKVRKWEYPVHFQESDQTRVEEHHLVSPHGRFSY